LELLAELEMAPRRKRKRLKTDLELPPLQLCPGVVLNQEGKIKGEKHILNNEMENEEQKKRSEF
jgi:hypothetical protein